MARPRRLAFRGSTEARDHAPAPRAGSWLAGQPLRMPGRMSGWSPLAGPQFAGFRGARCVFALQNLWPGESPGPPAPAPRASAGAGSLSVLAGSQHTRCSTSRLARELPPLRTPACRAAWFGTGCTADAPAEAVVRSLSVMLRTQRAIGGVSPDQRTPSGKRLTITVCTPNSSTSTNAASPSGPKASGIAISSSEKVPR